MQWQAHREIILMNFILTGGTKDCTTNVIGFVADRITDAASSCPISVNAIPLTSNILSPI